MRENDVIVGDNEIVRRVEIDVTGLAPAPERRPGMCRVRALEPRLPRRRNGADITADLGGRQPKTTQARDHDVCKILADTAPLLKRDR